MNKPKFNPAAAFVVGREPSQSLTDLPVDSGKVKEPVPQSKPKFNPNAAFDVADNAQPQEAAPQMGGFLDRAQTQLESFGNTVSANYLPQLQAAHEMLMGDPNAEVDAKLKAQGFTLNQPESSYVNMRDENIARQQAQAQRNPYDAVAGTLGGMAVTTPIISAGTVALNGGKVALSGIQRLKDSARLGATLGLVSNPGDTEGVVSPLQAVDRLKNTATGGAVGAGGQAVGETVSSISNAVKNTPQVLDKFAKTKAFKAMGAVLKDFRMANGQNSPEEIGETLLKKNIVSPGDTLETMAEKTGVARQEVGQKIRDVYARAKEAIGYTKTGVVGGGLSPREQKLLDITELNGPKLADTVLGKLSKGFKNNLDNTQAKQRVMDVVENLKASGDDIDLQDLLDMRRNLDESINYSKKLMEQPVVQQQLKTVRDVLHKAIQNRVRVIGKLTKDKTLINELRTANKEYGHLATAERVAKDKIARDSANRYFSLGDRLTSGAGATIGAATGDSPEERIRNGLVGLVAGGVAGKVGRHSLSTVSAGAYKVSKSTQALAEKLKTPKLYEKYGKHIIEAAKRTPEEFQALINQLGKDPEFKKILAPQGATQ